MGKGKPKLPKAFEPPFSVRETAGDNIVVDEAGNIIAYRGKLSYIRGRNSKAEMNAVCYALNIAYPVRRSSKRAKGGRK